MQGINKKEMANKNEDGMMGLPEYTCTKITEVKFPVKINLEKLFMGMLFQEEEYTHITQIMLP